MNNKGLVRDFYLGDWLVIPKKNTLKSNQGEKKIEPKMMQVLLYLCQSNQTVVSTDLLIKDCWPNQFFSDNPVHKCIARLRKALGDDAKQPKYIKTISKKGYSIVKKIVEFESYPDPIKDYWQSGPPYLAFESYQEQHQSIMCGRTKATSEIKQLIDQLDLDSCPMIMILGPHSVGKTSIIDAQIIPHLKVPNRPYKNQFDQIYKFTLNYSLHQNQQKRIRDELKKLTNNSNHSSLSDQNSTHTKHVLFIDQIERLLFNNSATEIQSFLTFLCDLGRSNKYLIITAVNHEFYADLMEINEFQSLKKSATVYDLLPPDHEELREIIRQPVLTSGLSFEYDKVNFESLDHLLIADAKDLGHSLPLVSYAMRELCLNKNEYQQLTYSAYQEMGGFLGVITNKFNQIFNACTVVEQEAFTDQLHLLIKVDPKQGDKLYCVDVPLKELMCPELKRLFNELLNANLFKVTVADQQTHVAIVHQALLNRCDVFKNWVADNQLKMSRIAEIDVMHCQWVNSNESDDYLINNSQLLQAARNFDLNSSEARFVSESLNKLHKRSFLKKLAIAALMMLLVLTFGLLIQLKHNHNNLSDINLRAEALNVFLLDQLKEKLIPLGQLSLLEMISRQIIDFYQIHDNKTSPRSTSIVSTNHVVRALNTLGEVKIKSGENDEALRYLRTANDKITMVFAIDANQPEALFHHSQTHYWIGYIHFLNKSWVDTEYHWFQYLESTKKLISLQPKNLDWQLEFSYALNNLGTLSLEKNEFSSANEYINQSAEIKRNLVKQEPQNDQYIAELSDTISWQANLLLKNNDFQTANKLYLESLSVSQQLLQLDGSDLNWHYRIALAHYRAGRSRYNLGFIEQAKVNFEQSQDILKRLVKQDQFNQKWLQTLINNHIYMAKSFYHLKQYDESLKQSTEGMNYFLSNSVQRQRLKSSILQYMGLVNVSSLVLTELGQTKTAISQFEKALLQVHKNNDTDIFSLYEQAQQHLTMSYLYKKDMQTKTEIDSAKVKIKEALLQQQNSAATKALFLQIHRFDQSASKYDDELNTIERELASMNFKNPDFFTMRK